MKPRYAVGNKVRIKPGDFLERSLNPELRQYENMTGEIIESVGIMAFIGETRANPERPGGRITVYCYTVRINDQITLYDITEDCLEISQ